MSIDVDDAKIPHVCYKMTYIRPYSIEPEGMRVLAVSFFQQEFELVQPAAPAADPEAD